MVDAKPETQKPTLSKTEAVRQALAHLGNTATRGQIKTYIKDTFDIEMHADHISTTKAEINRKAGIAKASPAKAVSAKLPTPKATASAPRHTPAPKPAGISIEDILKLHDLIQRVGINNCVSSSMSSAKGEISPYEPPVA